MTCKRRAQEVAVIGDNFMLPERPGALWSYAWRSSVSERRRSSQGWADLLGDPAAISCAACSKEAEPSGAFHAATCPKASARKC